MSLAFLKCQWLPMAHSVKFPLWFASPLAPAPALENLQFHEKRTVIPHCGWSPHCTVSPDCLRISTVNHRPELAQIISTVKRLVQAASLRGSPLCSGRDWSTFLCQSDLGTAARNSAAIQGKTCRQVGQRAQVQTRGHSLGQPRWRSLEPRTKRSGAPTKTIIWATGQRKQRGQLGFQ